MSYINQLSAFRITGTWQEHLDRGSLGGIDYGTPVGTPLRAPSACRIVNTPNNGTGGHTVTMYFADGTRDQYMHLSRFVTADDYAQGAIVGFSGGAIGSAGAGASTGPHTHWHKILANGTRVNPLNYLSNVAGGGGTPITETSDTVRIIQDKDTGQYWRLGEFSALKLAPSVAAQEAIVWMSGRALAVDHAVAVQAVADATAARATLPAGGTAGATPTEIATAVQSALADDFAAIPDAVIAEIAS